VPPTAHGVKTGHWLGHAQPTERAPDLPAEARVVGLKFEYWE